MNLCDDRHEPQYLVTYNSAQGNLYRPMWLVCKDCFKTKHHFGSKEFIESVELLSKVTA